MCYLEDIMDERLLSGLDSADGYSLEFTPDPLDPEV